MKKFTTLLFALTLLFTMPLLAQEEAGAEEENPLVITGSVDTYYKYDFSGNPNIQTSFAKEQNAVSIGMIDIGLTKTVGKASFVGEVSFGPRGQSQSLLNVAGSGEDSSSFHIQNLYASYAFTDQLSLTVGYMSTFVGYELISPTGNFNYSTSYLFTNGPFQNAGIKLNYAVSDRFAVMVGLFNDWNVYFDDNGVSDFGAQIYFSPVEGWDAYLNLITGYPSGTEIDLSTGYQLTEEFYLGLNVADYTAIEDAGGFSGVALYAQYALTESFALGVRGETFAFKDVEVSDIVIEEGGSVNAFTLSGNITSGPLTFIPELRIDVRSDEGENIIFRDSDGALTSTATQILLAVVYAF